MLYPIYTRPDLSYPVHLLSQFMHAPRIKNLAAATRVLRYLKCTARQGLLFPSKNDLILNGYCDSDWGGCPNSRKSVIGYSLMLSSLISWQSKKQSVTSRSIAEAKYRALAYTSEIISVHTLLTDLQIQFNGPTEVHRDQWRSMSPSPATHPTPLLQLLPL